MSHTRKYKMLENNYRKLSENIYDIKDEGNLKLNLQYLFESFVVNESNNLAYKLSLEISKKTSKYNPLFIYGENSSGKIHLLQAIGNEAIKTGLNVVYISIEEFIRDFTNSLKNKNLETFRSKYNKCNLLLIDDIQFISGKEQTQEEFFHIYNEFINHEKQIVIASDRLPSKIAGLATSLKTRFQWGLIVKIEMPEFETRILIIEKKSKFYNLKISNEITNYIAENTKDSRGIEGYLKTISAITNLIKKEISLDTIKNLFKE
jgi:chromosomal replication initiator protein